MQARPVEPGQFGKRMAAHAAWVRRSILKLPDTDGVVLPPPASEDGRNFTDPAAAAYVAGLPRPLAERARRELTNEVAFAANLLAPLAEDLRLATALIGDLLPGQVASVTLVSPACAPDPDPDGASEIRFERRDGRTATLLLLPPPLSGADPSARIERAVRRLPEGGVLAALRHPADPEQTHAAIAAQQDARGRVLDVRLDVLLDLWRRRFKPGDRQWLNAVAVRYLALGLSESMWADQSGT